MDIHVTEGKLYPLPIFIQEMKKENFLYPKARVPVPVYDNIAGNIVFTAGPYPEQPTGTQIGQV